MRGGPRSWTVTRPQAPSPAQEAQQWPPVRESLLKTLSFFLGDVSTAMSDARHPAHELPSLGIPRRCCGTCCSPSQGVAQRCPVSPLGARSACTDMCVLCREPALDGYAPEALTSSPGGTRVPVTLLTLKPMLALSSHSCSLGRCFHSIFSFVLVLLKHPCLLLTGDREDPRTVSTRTGLAALKAEPRDQRL